MTANPIGVTIVPGAARAEACADNPTPLVILCRRLVRVDGVFGGYALGAERKAAFLTAEGVRELLPR